MNKRLLLNLFLLATVTLGVIYQRNVHDYFSFYFVLVNLWLILNINFHYSISKFLLQFKFIFTVKNYDEIAPSDYSIYLTRYLSLLVFIILNLSAYYSTFIII